MRVLVLDIGNSNMKCAVYPTDDIDEHFVEPEILPTSRGLPWDMVDKARNMIKRAMREKPDIGIVTAFGDAFINISEKVPRYVFADEPAVGIIGGYEFNGWPRHIEITGIRSLRRKHRLAWQDILPVNMFVLNQLTDASEPHVWDKTQASVSGEYHLMNDIWVDTADSVMLCEPSTIVTRFNGLPICAGGLDNAFIDIDDTSPYVIAGTWRVVGRVVENPEGHFTNTRNSGGVRWLRSATGKLHMQTVRRSGEPPMPKIRARGEVTPHLDAQAAAMTYADLDMLGVTADACVRVFGGYGRRLADAMRVYAPDRGVRVPYQHVSYQLRQVAKYVHSVHANREVLAA